MILIFGLGVFDLPMWWHERLTNYLILEDVRFELVTQVPHRFVDAQIRAPDKGSGLLNIIL